MGHDEELVRTWATENAIVAKGQEWYNRIAAPMAMEHDDHIMGAPTDQSIRILIDGGLCHHNFGKDTAKYSTNIRNITPFPITTGITWLDKQCDLNLPGILLTNGYIDDHLHNTLLSEGILAKEKDWSFRTDGRGKMCTHPQGSFKATLRGHLFYLPDHIIGISPEVIAGATTKQTQTMKHHTWCTSQREKRQQHRVTIRQTWWTLTHSAIYLIKKATRARPLN